MADVRALLRAEKASRAASSQTPSAPTQGKKRRLTDSPGIDRKRSRTVATVSGPSGLFDGGQDDNEEEEQEEADINADQVASADPLDATLQQPASPPAVEQGVSIPAPAAEDTVDEAEWAAFERDVVNAPDLPPPAAYQSGAVIEAAPMTAAQIAAQATGEHSKQRTIREIEIEAEKEDAVRALEEEFEAMEALEDRVRKLREKREALRRPSIALPMDEKKPIIPQQPTPEEEEMSDLDDEDEDDFDDWRFGRA